VAINEYPGAVVLVSHDRYLIDACADRLWLVENGQVASLDGDLEQYRRHILVQRQPANDAVRPQTSGMPSAGRAEARRAAARLRVELAPLRRRIAAADGAVQRLTEEIGRIDVALSDAGLFARDPAMAATLAKARANAVDALARAEDEWIAASAELETATT
jgi:ATP-binding cassette subfamily F protein 3